MRATRRMLRRLLLTLSVSTGLLTSGGMLGTAPTVQATATPTTVTPPVSTPSVRAAVPSARRAAPPKAAALASPAATPAAAPAPGKTVRAGTAVGGPPVQFPNTDSVGTSFGGHNTTVFNQTLVGDFTQGGNGLLDCSMPMNGSTFAITDQDISTGAGVSPTDGGCNHDIVNALENPSVGQIGNNTALMKYYDGDDDPNTVNSSSATVTVPDGAHVVYAELEWLGSTQCSPNGGNCLGAGAGGTPDNDLPDIKDVPGPNNTGGWNPEIWQEPMKVAINVADPTTDADYTEVNPDFGTSINPGYHRSDGTLVDASPASDINDFYYSSVANITSLMSGLTGQITLWGADASFPANGFAEAGLGWSVVVAYQYDNPSGHVGKEITIQTGFIYQQANVVIPPTTVNIPEVTDQNDVGVGVIVGEGDAGLSGDTFQVKGENEAAFTSIPRPAGPGDTALAGLSSPPAPITDNFFVSSAPTPANPQWTSNFSIAAVQWTIQNGDPPVVSNGDKTLDLMTHTTSDGYFLVGLNTSIPVPAISLTKAVDPPTFTHVGQTVTYTYTVRNVSEPALTNIHLTDQQTSPMLPLDDLGTSTDSLESGDVVTFTSTHVVTATDIANGHIDNTATATAEVVGATDIETAPAMASATTTTSTTLDISKTSSPNPVNVGDGLTYKIDVDNTGGADAANVDVTDALPTGFTPTSANVTQGGMGSTATLSGQNLTASTPLLSAGGTFEIEVHGTVDSSFTGTTITNNASVTADGNTNCPVMGGTDTSNCTTTWDTTVLQPAAIMLTKQTDASMTVKPGDQFTYQVVVTNTSNTTIANAHVDDAQPSNLSGFTWSCAATPASGGVPASTCAPASGTGDISADVVLQPLGAATFTINATVDPTFQGGTITNAATATPGSHTVCEMASDCTDHVDLTVTPDPAEIFIHKHATPFFPGEGDDFTYTVVVHNPSPSTIANATFNDPVPAGVDATTGWTTTLAGMGTSASPPNDTGFPSGVTLAIAPGGTVTFTIHARVATPYLGTDVTNIATVTPGTNTVCGKDPTAATCNARYRFADPATLNVVKTHTAATLAPQPGEQYTYTVTVTNTATDATGAGTFTDDLSAATPTGAIAVPSATWTCTPSAGGTCGAASGTGSPTGVAITVAPSGTVTFAITVMIPTAVNPTPVTITNTGTVTPSDGTMCQDGQPTCSGVDMFTANPDAPISITKDQVTDPNAGDPITYTVTVTNESAITPARATFDDPVPAQIVADGTWTTATTGTGTTATAANGSGFPTGVALMIAPGGSVTFTITGHVAGTYNGDVVTNIATATPVAGSGTRCEDGQPTCRALASFNNPAQLFVTKSHTPTTPDPRTGQRVTWDVTVQNPVASAVASGTFSDPLPSTVDAAGATWTCTPSAGSTCGTATGTGSPTNVPITVARNNGTVVFRISATIRASGSAITVRNEASVTPGRGTVCTDLMSPCTAVDTFSAEPEPAALAVTKTHAPASPTQGQAVTYTVRVTNASTTTVGHGTLTDPFDTPALSGISWTAATTGTGSRVAPTSASGPITNVALTLAPGGTATFTVHATVLGAWPGGDVINTAVVTPGANTMCSTRADASCSAPSDFPTPSLISIVKTHELPAPVAHPGDRVVYRAVVTNQSWLQAAHATLDDPLPAALQASAATWTTETTGPGTTVKPSSGTGPPHALTATLGPRGTVTVVIHARILPSFQGGTVTNTASATPGQLTACDPSAPPCTASTSFDPEPVPAPLQILKSASPAGPMAPGAQFTYTITVTNTSATTVGRGTVTDAIPAGVLPGPWTAQATPGSSVGTASGSGVIDDVPITVAPGGTVTFVRQGTVDPHFNGDFAIANSATLTPGANTVCDPNIPMQTCDGDAVFPVNIPAPPMAPQAPIVPGAKLPVTG